MSAPAGLPRPDCLTAKATVAATDGRGGVELRLLAAKGCEGCGGLCLWRRLPAETREHFRSPLALEVGEEVLVRFPLQGVLRATLLLHGLPLAALLGGGLAGAWLTGSDWGCLAGAVALVALVLATTPRLRAAIEASTLAAIELERAGPEA